MSVFASSSSRLANIAPVASLSRRSTEIVRRNRYGFVKRGYAVAPPPTRPYTFHVGASFIGKPAWDDENRPPNNPFPDTHPVVPFRDRMLEWKREVPSENAGQDFFFVENMRDKSGLAIGVADGVGGWGDTLDPSLFSQALMYHASQAARASWPSEPEVDPILDVPHQFSGSQLNPTECMDIAHRAVLGDDAVEGGASTACIMTLDCTSGQLKAANLGDSGFYVIRGAQLIHSEPPQTHYFNCPWQLSKYPPTWPKQSRLNDRAESASKHRMRLRHGDIIIAYTDGLSDNVFKNEILNYTMNIMRRPAATADGTAGPILSGVHEDKLRAQYIADFLVIHARRCMFDYGRVSPFELEWAENQKSSRVYHGGKVDDVSVLVVIVQEGP